MKYTVNVNGQTVEVTKAVYDEYRRNTRQARHDRYVVVQSKKHEVPLSCIGKMGTCVSAEEELINKEKLMVLKKAIENLSCEEQLLIKQLFFDNKSEIKIAEELGVAKGTVNYRKNRILEKLRKMMDS